MLVEKEVGTGNGSVYVYYFQSYKAESDAWPCKIGKSNGHPEARIRKQQASMVEEPVIGLIIWTDNPQLNEAIIHNVLSESRMDSFGKEWFYTNPERVEHAHRNGLGCDSMGSLVRLARYERGLTQTELASMAGIRQETVSTIECGNKTTTHAIEKLFSALGKKMTLVDVD